MSYDSYTFFDYWKMSNLSLYCQQQHKNALDIYLVNIKSLFCVSFFVCLFVCLCTHAWHRTRWRSQDNLQESVLSFHRVGIFLKFSGLAVSAKPSLVIFDIFLFLPLYILHTHIDTHKWVFLYVIIFRVILTMHLWKLTYLCVSGLPAHGKATSASTL